MQQEPSVTYCIKCESLSYNNNICIMLIYILCCDAYIAKAIKIIINKVKIILKFNLMPNKYYVA